MSNQDIIQASIIGNDVDLFWLLKNPLSTTIPTECIQAWSEVNTQYNSFKRNARPQLLLPGFVYDIQKIILSQTNFISEYSIFIDRPNDEQYYIFIADLVKNREVLIIPI